MSFRRLDDAVHADIAGGATHHGPLLTPGRIWRLLRMLLSPVRK